jgi:hypothetical protein
LFLNQFLDLPLRHAVQHHQTVVFRIHQVLFAIQELCLFWRLFTLTSCSLSGMCPVPIKGIVVSTSLMPNSSNWTIHGKDIFLFLQYCCNTISIFLRSMCLLPQKV